MGWKQKRPENDEAIGAWEWASGGLLCAALLVVLYSCVADLV
jgi:hypothetical protein